MSKFDQTLKVLKDQNQPLESIEENNDISQEKLDRQNELLEKLHIKTDRLRPTQVKSIVTQQSDQQDKIVDAINEGFKSNVKEIVVKENKKLSSVVTTQQHPDGGPTWKQIDDKLREDIKLIKNQAEIDRRRGKSTALNAVELTAPALAWVYKKLKDVDENEYVKNTSWGKEQEKANKDLIKAVEKSNPEIHITPEKLKLDKRKETENSEKSVDAIEESVDFSEESIKSVEQTIPEVTKSVEQTIPEVTKQTIPEVTKSVEQTIPEVTKQTIPEATKQTIPEVTKSVEQNDQGKTNKELIIALEKSIESRSGTQINLPSQSDEPQEEVLINAGVKVIDVAGKTVSAVKKTNKAVDDLADKFDNDANKFSKAVGGVRVAAGVAGIVKAGNSFDEVKKLVENIDNKTLTKSAAKLTGKSLAKEIARQSSGPVKNLVIMGDYLKRIVETNEERNLLAQQSAATAEEMARLAKLDKKERQRELANKRQVEKDTGVKDPVLEKMRKKKSMWFWIIALAGLGLAGFVTGTIAAFVNKIKSFLVLKVITPIFTALEKTKWGKKILEVGSFIKSKIAAFFQGVKGFFKKAPKLPKLGKIRTALENTFPNIKKFFDGIGTVITKVNAFLSRFPKVNKAIKMVLFVLKAFFSKLFLMKKVFMGAFKLGAKLGPKLLLKALRFVPFVGQVLWAIETLVMGIFRGIQGAIEGFKEGGIIGGLIGFLKGFMKGAFEGFIGSILDLLKDGVAWILDKFGFSDLAGILRDFSFVETFNQTIDLLFGTIGNLFGWVKSIFVSDDEVVDGKETMSFWERMKETITKVWDAIKSFGIWVVKMAGFLSWGFFKLGELLEDPIILLRAKSKGIMGAIKSFKSLFARFMAGFFFVIYFIQGIVVTIWKSITGAIDGFKKGWNKTEGGWFKKLLGGIWGGIWGFLNGFLRGAMMGFLTLVLDGLKDATAFLLQGLSFLLKSLGKWTAIGFGKLFDKVFEIPKKILVWILKSLGFENMAKIVKDFSFKDVFLSILDHITSFLDILVEELKKISITEMAMDGLDHIFGFVETLWEKLKNVIGGFGDTLSDTFKHIKDAVSSLARGDMNGVKEALMEAIKTVVRSILPPPGQSFTESPIAWIKGKVIPDSVYEWVGINPLTGGKTTARLANEFTQSVKDNGRDSIETRNASRAFKMESFRDRGREQGLKGLELEEYASNRYIREREIQKAREAKMEKKVLPAPTLDVPAILGVGKKPEGITGVLSVPAGVGQGMTKEEEIKYMLHRLKDPSLAPEIRDEHIKTLNKLKVPIESIPKNTSGPLMQSTTMGGNITVINNNTTGDTRNYSANSNTNVSAVTAGMPVPAPSAMAGGH